MTRALIYLAASVLAFVANGQFGGVLQSDLLIPDGCGIFQTIGIGLILFAAFHAVLRIRRVPTPASLDVSFLLALGYGAFGSSFYQGDPPYVAGTLFKASGIVVLGLVALFARSRLLAAGLLFGALGDALLAWREETFLYGALAFLVGHIFYIALFLRAGDGVAAALRRPPRVIAAVALIIAAVVMTLVLVPRDSAMFVPLSVYTGVLTLMALTSFTLPESRWLAMVGAVLFFVSDGFVAWNMFHPDADPNLAFWRSFAGWMIYWAGQAAICYGALGLHKAATRS